MKKIFLFNLLLLFSTAIYPQQELNIGFNGGFTNGDIKANSSLAFGFDSNYLFDLYENFKFGPSLSAIYFNPKSGIANDPYVFIPVGLAIKFQTTDDPFYIGSYIGFALGLSPNNNRKGLYFKPFVGYEINEKIKIDIFYSAVKKNNPTYSYLGLGLIYNVFGYRGFSRY